MHYLEKHTPLKTNPQKLLPNCQSIILVGFNYYQERTASQLETGQIARYAHGRDYHKVLGKRLKKVTKELQELYPDANFYANTDATPLLERKYAEQAGLGFIGKNTMTISLPYGSWFLVGEILTTQKLPASGPTPTSHGTCGSCIRCLEVCPTGALTPNKPYQLDASKCISYLTIEHRGSIPTELRPLIGNWLFGCDLCQEVCPHNVRAKITTEPDFLKPIAGHTQLLKEILTIKTDAEFLNKFAGSPVMRAKREGLIRNACIVAGNIRATELIPLLEQLSQDSNTIISEHAQWALMQIACQPQSG